MLNGNLIGTWKFVLGTLVLCALQTWGAPLDDAEYLYQFNTAAPTNNTGTAGSAADLTWNAGQAGSADVYQTDGAANYYSYASVYNQASNDTWGLYCDGSGGDYLKATSSTVADFSGDFTIFVRHYRRDGEPFLVRKGVNSSNPGYSLQRQPTQFALYSFPFSAADTLYLGDGLLSAGKAYDVTMMFDASEQLLSGYIHDWEGNLVVYSNKTVSHTGHSNSDALLLGSSQGGTPDNGGIEMVALWDRVLSSNEVSLLSTLPVDQGPAEYVYEFNTAAPTNNTGTAGSGADLTWNGGGLGSAGFYQTDGGGNDFTDADVYNQVGNDTWGLNGDATDYLKATSSTVADFTGDFTVFIRHYRNTGDRFLVAKAANSSGKGYALQRQEGLYKLYIFPYSEADSLELGSGLLTVGKAYDVTMMFDASEKLLSGYIYDWTGNRVVYSNKTVNNPGLSNSDYLEIGGWHGSGTPDDGGIERVSIWDRLLSSNEVFRLSNPPKGTLITIQ